MQKKPWKPRQTERFDLSRYGLAHLAGSDVLTLSSDELDRVLKAMGEEDIAVRVPIASTPENVERLISQSQCRRCGKCCSPDHPNPDNPGIEALEDELKAIADELKFPYETLKEKTTAGKPVYHPAWMESVSFTRYLPLPCPFFDVEKKGCTVYSVRPIVCRLHPVVFGEHDLISIRAACDYGKGLIRAAFKEVKTEHLEMVMRI